MNSGFLMLAFEEIRHYGAGSRHVMRRMRALLSDLIDVAAAERCPALRREQERLDAIIARSLPD